MFVVFTFTFSPLIGDIIDYDVHLGMCYGLHLFLLPLLKIEKNVLAIFFLLHLRLCLQKKYKAYLKTGGNSQKYGVNRKKLCSLNIQ